MAKLELLNVGMVVASRLPAASLVELLAVGWWSIGAEANHPPGQVRYFSPLCWTAAVAMEVVAGTD